jgi:cell division protein ZapA (FtsZ GTPase activity inhibitor)
MSKNYPHRFDLRLTDEQMEALREVAEELDRPVAAMARRLVALGLKQHQKRKVAAR